MVAHFRSPTPSSSVGGPWAPSFSILPASPVPSLLYILMPSLPPSLPPLPQVVAHFRSPTPSSSVGGPWAPSSSCLLAFPVILPFTFWSPAQGGREGGAIKRLPATAMVRPSLPPSLSPSLLLFLACLSCNFALDIWSPARGGREGGAIRLSPATALVRPCLPSLPPSLPPSFL